MYDVIVIGAGPAGSVAASAVAKAGYSVLVLEKNDTCRSPCAGYISSTINTYIPKNSTIQSRIMQMRTYLPDLSFHDFQLNGFVVDRSSFDRSLAARAEDAGAVIKWESPLLDIATKEVNFRGGKAEGQIIIGADGVFSRTASLAGFKRQRIASCAQYHLKGIESISNTAEIFFNVDYAPGGYVWIYPTGNDSAKVGVGITIQASPREYLDAFINESHLSCRLDGTKTEYITGALPIGGLRERLYSGNVLLAGDSAGMADPITGAGINNAMLAGEIAAKTIIKALENEDMTILREYETRVKRLLGRPLGRSLEKRKRLDACYASNETLEHYLPELWVTFKEYWER